MDPTTSLSSPLSSNSYKPTIADTKQTSVPADRLIRISPPGRSLSPTRCTSSLVLMTPLDFGRAIPLGGTIGETSSTAPVPGSQPGPKSTVPTKVVCPGTSRQWALFRRRARAYDAYVILQLFSTRSLTASSHQYASVQERGKLSLNVILQDRG